MIGEGFYNSSVDCILSHVSFLCQEEINLAPVNILVGAMAHHGGGEGLWRCFLPDCPGCIVYQLSTDNLSGSDRAGGGTAGETWEVKATPVRVDATWKDNLTCMDLKWEDIVELLHDRPVRNVRANIATKLFYSDTMMVDGTIYLSLLIRVQQAQCVGCKKMLMFTPFALIVWYYQSHGELEVARYPVHYPSH